MKSKIHEHQQNNSNEVSTNDLLFDFTVDKAAQTVYITREFDAELSLVWDAYTKPELLDQWYAPKPYTSKTKFMNFEVGGRRFYAMVSPEGQERWAIQKYTSITPKTNFKLFNAFADAAENPELPGSEWDLSFSEENGKTKVRVTIYNESLARMEKQLEMGFKEGSAMQLKNLDELLAALSQK
ncbi:MAG: SRPBCC domain-containing protein [Ferruginibacter sp.]